MRSAPTRWSTITTPDDATFVTFESVVRGRDALKPMFRDYLESVGYIDVVSTDQVRGDGRHDPLRGDRERGPGQSRVYDALVLRDDKIPYHFAGVMGDQTPADADEEGAEWPSR